jgi:hypothetical protein
MDINKMNPFRFFAVFSTICGYSLAFTIRNSDSPICSNCKYYKPSYTYSEYEQKTGHCKLFGEVDIVSGEVSYDSIYMCRRDENKCGFDGKLYEFDEWKTIKVLKHDIRRNNYIFFLAIPTIYVFALYVILD